MNENNGLPAGIIPLSIPVQSIPAIWIRPPVGKETCPHTGLKHAAFYLQFCKCPRIRNARMGKGEKRGTRLLYLPDIMAELERIAAQTAIEEGRQG